MANIVPDRALVCPPMYCCNGFIPAESLQPPIAFGPPCPSCILSFQIHGLRFKTFLFTLVFEFNMKVLIFRSSFLFNQINSLTLG